MSFLKKIFNLSVKEDSNKLENQEENLSIDEVFVHNFVSKGGMFLYCTNKTELTNSLDNILKENNWSQVSLLNNSLSSFFKKKEIDFVGFNENIPVFSLCEHLIIDNGSILFSSNQLKSTKLSEMPQNFIVYATTSQMVKSMGQALTGIKKRYKENLPTNISAIKNYTVNKNEDNLLNIGNTNSKNLYLLLLEDL
ncbi:MAG: hypothetical protein P8L21_00815 [Polaribacter sp.]|jgi:L-lactate utilization protein LutC|nr:hypothetical protein [Polaribacter sp.]MDG2356805.1 hypothetical protein [Polaribacter sp.]